MVAEFWKRAWPLVLWTWLPWQAPASGSEGRDQAPDALGGVQGICVVLGCEEALPWLPDVADRGNLAVHGLAWDADGLARSRQKVLASGITATVAVETATGRRLPYRDHLVNALVVTDARKAQAVGVEPHELLRVLAPGGLLIRRTGVAWESERKPFPKGMDEWTHPDHGPDGNRLSSDTLVSYPVAYRWHAGLPLNVSNPQRKINAYMNIKGLALAGGRLFTLSDSVFENLAATYDRVPGIQQYVTARDAFNGSLLWRRSVGETYYGSVHYWNKGPFVAVGDRVFTASGEGKLLVLDARTGDVVRAVETRYPPIKVLVTDRSIVAVEWKGGTKIGGRDVSLPAGEVDGRPTFTADRRELDWAVEAGAVQVFDAGSYENRWTREVLAVSAAAAEGRLVCAVREGKDEREGVNIYWNGLATPEAKAALPEQASYRIAAFDLAGGGPAWERDLSDGKTSDLLRVMVAGNKVVVVAHNRGEKCSVLALADGRKIFQVPRAEFAYLVGDQIAMQGRLFDPLTGQAKGPSPVSPNSTICTPIHYVNGLTVNNRATSEYVWKGQPLHWYGLRGACGFGSVPAYGAFFNAQNWCKCYPPQIDGFISFGPVGGVPSPEEMGAAPALIQGPGYGRHKPSNEGRPDGWTMYRGDPTRGNATTVAAPTRLTPLWSCAAATRPQDTVARDYQEALTPPVTQAVTAGGLTVWAVSDENRVVAVDAATGATKWQFLCGGRVDTSPTLARGLCLFGSHDGYVYAVSAHDGTLNWSFRAAPREERMVSYRKIESPWPVTGSVLVDGGTGYVSAGRTEGSDGGVVVRAFQIETGKPLWSKVFAGPSLAAPTAPTTAAEAAAFRAAAREALQEVRRNDILLKVQGGIQLMASRIDAATRQRLPHPHLVVDAGRPKADARRRQGAPAGLENRRTGGPEVAPSSGLDGFLCTSWPRLGTRRYDKLHYGALAGEVLSWGEDFVATGAGPGAAVTVYPRSEVRPYGSSERARQAWGQSIGPDHQLTGLAICGNAVVASGGVYAGGKAQGFIRVLDITDGKVLDHRVFPTVVSVNGVSVAEARITVSFEDGSVACLGESQTDSPRRGVRQGR